MPDHDDAVLAEDAASEFRVLEESTDDLIYAESIARELMVHELHSDDSSEAPRPGIDCTWCGVELADPDGPMRSGTVRKATEHPELCVDCANIQFGPEPKRKKYDKYDTPAPSYRDQGGAE